MQALGCHASAAASAITVLLTAGLLTPIDWAPILSRHLQLVTCMAQAVQATALAKQEQTQQTPNQQQSVVTVQEVERGGTASAGGEEGGGAVEGPLLALALHLGQTPLGAQVLLEQGVAGFIPALAKWLLSSDSGGDNTGP